MEGVEGAEGRGVENNQIIPSIYLRPVNSFNLPEWGKVHEGGRQGVRHDVLLRVLTNSAWQSQVIPR